MSEIAADAAHPRNDRIKKTSLMGGFVLSATGPQSPVECPSPSSGQAPHSSRQERSDLTPLLQKSDHRLQRLDLMDNIDDLLDDGFLFS